MLLGLDLALDLALALDLTADLDLDLALALALALTTPPTVAVDLEKKLNMRLPWKFWNIISLMLLVKL